MNARCPPDPRSDFQDGSGLAMKGGTSVESVFARASPKEGFQVTCRLNDSVALLAPDARDACRDHTRAPAHALGSTSRGVGIYGAVGG